MNKNQVAGAAKRVVGKLQESAGKAVGNRTQQIKGVKRRIDGNAQEAVGDIEHAARILLQKK